MPPPVISPDGQYVAFSSTSGDLVPGFTNPSGTDQLYLRNLATGTTSVLSIAPDGQTAGNHESYEPVFSADSHHVGFVSYATNLVSGVTFSVPSGQENVFERNLITGTTQLVSMSMNGQSDGNSSANDAFGVSADGQYVAFSDTSTNLTPQSVAGDDNHGVSEVYVRDTVDGTTTMVSVVMNGTAGGNTGSAA